MKPIIIKNSSIAHVISLFFPILAITIYPFIFIRDEKLDIVILNHEMIHIKQYEECFIIGFIFYYFLDYLRIRLKGNNHLDSYLGIRLELEAYKYQNDLNYLNRRKKFFWKRLNADLKYLPIKKRD